MFSHFQRRAFRRMLAEARQRRKQFRDEWEAKCKAAHKVNGYAVVYRVFGFWIAERIGWRWVPVGEAATISGALREIERLQQWKAG